MAFLSKLKAGSSHGHTPVGLPSETTTKKISPQDKKISRIASSIFKAIKDFFYRLSGTKPAFPPAKSESIVDVQDLTKNSPSLAKRISSLSTHSTDEFEGEFE